MSDLSSRSQQLDRVIAALLAQAPEVEAAAVVSFDGLPMASALPATMDEDRVAAMSASLLSLGERAAEGLGRGGLNQVYIEGDSGTVFLVSAEDEAVLVAVAAAGAKVGMMLYEVRRAAENVAEVLRTTNERRSPRRGRRLRPPSLRRRRPRRLRRPNRSTHLSRCMHLSRSTHHPLPSTPRLRSTRPRRRRRPRSRRTSLHRSRRNLRRTSLLRLRRKPRRTSCQASRRS